MRIHTYTQCFLERNGTRYSILNRRDLQQSCTKKKKKKKKKKMGRTS